MKIALAFWGLTRSLKYTISSIKKYIFEPLQDHDVTVFVHTFSVEGSYNNPRAREKGLTLNNEEYKLLGHSISQVESQKSVKEQLDLKQYKTKRDPWNTKYATVENFICAMYSKKQLVTLIQTSGKHFDYIIFLRPDVKYLCPIDTSLFQNANASTICVPNFHLYSHFNDRFCIATYENGLVYGNLFSHMLEYSKQHPLHSETFQYNCLTKLYNLKIHYVPFYFNRVRADGRVEKDCSVS
jgi:hypothetical protein